MKDEHPIKRMLREQINIQREMVDELKESGLDFQTQEQVLQRTWDQYNHNQRLYELENA